MKPRETAPDLSIKTVNGEPFKLSDKNPENFTMLVFYRGLHCPVCKSYLKELNKLLSNYNEKGIEVIAISMNNETLAQKTVDKWKLDKLVVGYELSKSQAKEWRLYLSKGISESEPDLFSEPGLFLVKADNSLYYASIQTMPFGRPDLNELLKGIKFVLNEDYPARGEV